MKKQDQKIDVGKHVNYWIDSSDKDYKTMNHMFKTKDYNWSLFIGHLVIEKLLKALYVKVKEEHAVFSHDLLRIAEKAEIDLTEDQKDILDTLTTFNINARYDDFKTDFYKKCTPAFTEEWIKKIKQTRKWIKELL